MSISEDHDVPSPLGLDCLKCSLAIDRDGIINKSKNLKSKIEKKFREIQSKCTFVLAS